MALSFVKYVGDGTQVNWTVTAPYISKAHIFVFVDDVSVPFVWLTNTLIKTTTAAASLAIVEVRRDTPITDPLVDFEDGGTLAEPDLDLAVLQQLYLAQEQADDIARSMNLAFDEEWDAENKEMKNLKTPSAPTALTDAINIEFLNTALVGSGNVPVPLDPSEDNMTLIATSGLWAWGVMLVENISDIVAVMKTFLKSADLATARTNLGLGTAAIKNHGAGAGDVPLNSDLGTASTKNVGTASGEVPMLDGVGMPAVSGNQMSFTAMINAMNWNKGTNIPSAATTDIGAATGNFVDITGVVDITALGTITAGTMRWCRFTGAGLTITHNATSLILLGGVDVDTAAGDIIHFASLGAGNWVMVDFIRKSGQPPSTPVFRGALVYPAAGGQTLTDATNIIIDFDAEKYDTDSFHDNVTNKPRLTIPAGISKIRVSGNIQTSVMSGIAWFHLQITHKNSADAAQDTIGLPFTNAYQADGATPYANVSSGVIEVSVGDYFELVCRQDTAGDETVAGGVNNGTWFAIEVIE